MSLSTYLAFIVAGFGVYTFVGKEESGLRPYEQLKRLMEAVTWSSETGKNENENQSCKSKILGYKWTPTSMDLLAQAETRILNRMKKEYKGQYVNIGPLMGSDEDLKVWTVSMNEEGRGTPLVLLHGFGAGIGFWSLNLDAFSTDRTVYAMDILGFGRSSRPKFSSDPQEAEREFVRAIEEWREKMNLKKIVLLGHSFGGFLATSYSISYPERVAKLILADPWGYSEYSQEFVSRLPVWAKAIVFVARQFNPFAIIRAAGPIGQNLLTKVRPDLINKFSALNQDSDEDVRFGEYVYHLNAQPPSGEEAFKTMANDWYGWAKFPILHRLESLSARLPITAIYGSTSWVQTLPEQTFRNLRPQGAYTNVHILQGAGHHLYSDGKEEFNRIVVKSCRMADRPAKM